MPKRLIVLLILAAFGCGFWAGPHPCHARRALAAGGHGGAMSCHAKQVASPRSGGVSFSASSDRDCCSGEHGSLCAAACQTIGIVRAAVLDPAIQPVEGSPANVPDCSLPLFVFALDHIPLA